MKTIADFKKKQGVTKLFFRTRKVNGVESKWSKALVGYDAKGKEITLTLLIVCKADAKPTDASAIREREPGTWLVENTYTEGRSFTV